MVTDIVSALLVTLIAGLGLGAPLRDRVVGPIRGAFVILATCSPMFAGLIAASAVARSDPGAMRFELGIGGAVLGACALIDLCIAAYCIRPVYRADLTTKRYVWIDSYQIPLLEL